MYLCALLIFQHYSNIHNMLHNYTEAFASIFSSLFYLSI